MAKGKPDKALAVLRALIAATPRDGARLAEQHDKTTGATLGIFEVAFLGEVPLKHLRRSSAQHKVRALVVPGATVAVGRALDLDTRVYCSSGAGCKSTHVLALCLSLALCVCVCGWG